jgi:type IV pilus assembly protein PilC
MADFVLKYADGRGQIHQQVASANSEKELREKYTQQGFLIYSIRPRTGGVKAGLLGGRKKLNLEKFLIFNQQFVTLIRAGLPILKALDLLAERLTDPNSGRTSNGCCATRSATARSFRGIPPAGPFRRSTSPA